MPDFIKNNLAVFVSVIFAFISACFNIYQYMENKRLEKYSTEKDLKKKKADLEKLQKDCDGELYLISIDDRKINDLKCRERHLMAEIEYLEKILDKKR